MAHSRFTIEKKREILDYQITNKIPNETVSEIYKVHVTTLYWWRKQLGYNVCEKRINIRKVKESLKVTSNLRGINKQMFLDDCTRRGFTSYYGKMLTHIIDTYYSIMSNRPDIQGKEMVDIKKYINERIKL